MTIECSQYKINFHRTGKDPVVVFSQIFDAIRDVLDKYVDRVESNSDPKYVVIYFAIIFFLSQLKMKCNLSLVGLYLIEENKIGGQSK